ncbi:peptidase domain protein [Arthrospira platensis C1]|nr:peptidase domain protein [Arthrospira platensis C1]
MSGQYFDGISATYIKKYDGSNEYIFNTFHGEIKMSSQSVNTINLDIFEPNDSRETATDLGLISEWNYWDNLSIHARDSDWFKFEIAQTGSVNNYLSISSWFHGENLNLSLYDSEGVLIYSTSSDGEERISLEGIEAGTYYFNIQGDDGVIRPSYSLYINAPWDMKPDKFEPNDSIETSTDLGLLSQMNYWYDISIHPEDSDWFKFAIANRGKSDDYVSIISEYDNPLNFSLYDAEGVWIETSSSDDAESISLEGLKAGTYHIQVYGDEGITNPDYSLDINAPSYITITPDKFESNDSLETATD